MIARCCELLISYDVSKISLKESCSILRKFYRNIFLSKNIGCLETQRNFVVVVTFHEKYRNKRIDKENTFYNAAFFTRSKGKNDRYRKHANSIFEDDSAFEALVRVFGNSQADSHVCSADAEIARCFFF